MTEISNERPAYRVLNSNGFYGPDDTLYAKDSEIYFDGEPNEEFEPLNEAAKQRLEAFFAKLDEEARKVAEKTGRAFIGRPKTEDGGYEMARAVELAKVPVMGHIEQKEVKTIATIDQSEIPETGKRGRGRPKKSLSV